MTGDTVARIDMRSPVHQAEALRYVLGGVVAAQDPGDDGHRVVARVRGVQGGAAEFGGVPVSPVLGREPVVQVPVPGPLALAPPTPSTRPPARRSPREPAAASVAD